MIDPVRIRYLSHGMMSRDFLSECDQCENQENLLQSRSVISKSLSTNFSNRLVKLVSGLLANIQALLGFKNGMELKRFDSVTDKEGLFAIMQAGRKFIRYGSLEQF